MEVSSKEKEQEDWFLDFIDKIEDWKQKQVKKTTIPFNEISITTAFSSITPCYRWGVNEAKIRVVISRGNYKVEISETFKRYGETRYEDPQSVNEKLWEHFLSEVQQTVEFSESFTNFNRRVIR